MEKLGQFQHPGPGDDRRGEKEGEAGGIGMAETAGEPRAHGQPRTRKSGDQRAALAKADDQGLAPA